MQVDDLSAFDKDQSSRNPVLGKLQKRCCCGTIGLQLRPVAIDMIV